MPVYATRCPECGTEEEDVILGVNEAPPLCECGATTARLLGSGYGRPSRAFKLFTPYTVQGSTQPITSKAEEQRVFADLKTTHPGKRFEVEHITKPQQLRETEERRHKLTAKYRAKGQENRARKLENKPLCLNPQ